MVSYSPGRPIYSSDPDVPPIYGYLPYGKYDKKGQWRETTPCQPSVIVVQCPDGRMIYAYEHKPGEGPTGKSQNMNRVQGRTLGQTVRNVEGTVNQLQSEVSKGIHGLVKSFFS